MRSARHNLFYVLNFLLRVDYDRAAFKNYRVLVLLVVGIHAGVLPSATLEGPFLRAAGSDGDAVGHDHHLVERESSQAVFLGWTG